MDVNLTISLMRGQMGVVIEKAVNAAVETVLGEMIRVVSLKFEEFRREMTAKEKENENIRNMLEMSRCQMKTMRKYMNALTAKEDRQSLQSRRQVLVQFEPGRVHNIHQSRDITPRRGPTNITVCAEIQNQNSASKPAHNAEPTWEKQMPKTHNLLQESVSTESYTSSDNYNEDVHAPKLLPGSMKAENSSGTVTESGGLVAESSDPLWSQTPPSSSEVEHTDMVDPNLRADTSEVFSTTAACSVSPFRIKQEESEVAIVQVKEEPSEAGNLSTSEGQRIEICQQATETGPGISLDLPVGQQCHQIPGPSITESGFISMDPSTYADSQLAIAGDQRQMHPWSKDLNLNLYEEYKRKRIEVRKRSETRRRELEQTLPQALLADLVKERREKTRLRVARWRAKRKLQACLMSQAAQFNGAPSQTMFTQRGCRKRGGGAAHPGGFTMGRVAPSDTGAYTLPLQMGSSPLLTAQRLSMTEGQIQPGSSMYPKQRSSTVGSDMYQ